MNTDRWFDLIDGSQIPDFVAWVAKQAITDHHHHPNARPSGQDLLEMRCTDWRIMHQRLATTVYNQTRRTLEVMDREKAEAGL